MIRKSAFLIALVIILMLTGCPEINNPEFSFDPDPVEDPSSLPSPAEDLYIVANVNGTIYGFDSSTPYNYTILTSDASIEENFSDIRISPNKTYLLYANNNKNLILFNIETSETTIIAENIASNESEFIDDTKLYYSVGGSVYFYTIGDNISHIFLRHEDNRCNHRAQLSPDLTRVAFKNQNVTTNDTGFHSWSSVTLTDESTIFNEILEYDPIDLYESFYYTWIDNNRVIFKNSPGDTSNLYEKNVGSGSSPITNAILQNNNLDILFDKILISSDRNNHLFLVIAASICLTYRQLLLLPGF